MSTNPSAAGSRRFTSIRQLELLVEFMEAHKDLALGRVQSKEARALASRLWAECATICNAEGIFRNPKEWSRYWNDVKGRVKTKLRSISRSMSGTGGGPSTDTTITPIEDRVAAILGRDVVTPLQGVQQNPFQSQAADEAPPESSHELMIVESDMDMNVLNQIIEEPVPDPSSQSQFISYDSPTLLPTPSTSVQPQVSHPEYQVIDHEHRPRARAPRRPLLSQQMESSMEQSRAILTRIEETKIIVEEKRLKIEEKKVEAMKEIALAINKLADVHSTFRSTSFTPNRHKRQRNVNTSESDE